jgi:hypothetical protein
MVDDASQDRWDNSGRLQSWADFAGFTYCDFTNDAYRGLGGTHRRSVLFVRSNPAYWLISDRMAGDGKVHDYRWLGHFQPTQLKVDPTTKTVVTAAVEGKRLWLVPARPDSFNLEEGSGPMCTPEPTGVQPPYHPNRAIGPYVALRQKAVNGPASFAVMLYPADQAESSPAMQMLENSGDESVGLRVRRTGGDDFIIVSRSSELRIYGSAADEIQTDAEVALIRRSETKIDEFALTGGRVLRLAGKALIEAGPEVRAVNARFVGDGVEITARGRGAIRVATQSATRVSVNGAATNAEIKEGYTQLEIGKLGDVAVSELRFSAEPAARCRGSGVPVGYGGTFQGYEKSALAACTTDVPAAMTIAYRPKEGNEWRRALNPVPTTDHYYLLTDLEDGKEYEVRIDCRDAEGRSGSVTQIYSYREPTKAQ